MPKPHAGSYYIVNTGLETLYNGTTQALAVTYNGEKAALTVTELRGQVGQEWFIADYSQTTQSISPGGDTSLQVCYKSAHELTVRPAYNYVWTISGQDLQVDTYTIQDGHKTVFWGLQQVAVGQPVYLGAGTDSALQNWHWKLIPAGTI
ncbi:hypothetical protein OG21DRAFT_1515358 [Imleria badia]|nr:hypothetical protein OG21DRAFT_1515358 [Imleria badia]